MYDFFNTLFELTGPTIPKSIIQKGRGKNNDFSNLKVPFGWSRATLPNKCRLVAFKNHKEIAFVLYETIANNPYVINTFSLCRASRLFPKVFSGIGINLILDFKRCDRFPDKLLDIYLATYYDSIFWRAYYKEKLLLLQDPLLPEEN